MEEKIIETKVSIYTFDELSLEEQKLLETAKKQVENAYAPYSNFLVGAALLLENGEVVLGNNQENAAYPSGLCAERVAMFYANSQNPNLAVKSIAIAAFTNGKFLSSPISPCGACRQALLESEVRFQQNIRILLYGTEHIFVVDSVKSLLPLCFEKGSLEEES